MSKTVNIESPAQFTALLSSSKVVVVDFYADWCGPCKAVAPLYEQLSLQLSRSNRVTFAKVNTDKQKEIALSYGITALPTFMTFKNGKESSKIEGVRAKELSDQVKKLVEEVDSEGSGASGAGEGSVGSAEPTWQGAQLPRGYSDVTDQVDLRGLDLLNADGDFGEARVLFENGKPRSLDVGKGKGKERSETDGGKPDWVESDTDDQLMLFIPFNSTLKIHTLQLTSLPLLTSGDDDELPMRPKTIHLYSNQTYNLGFEEAEGIPPTQTITLKPTDWDVKSATAKAELRFVKFQNVTSLVVFVVDGEGSGEKVRIDRLRIIGEAGEKREFKKLEKVGEE